MCYVVLFLSFTARVCFHSQDLLAALSDSDSTASAPAKGSWDVIPVQLAELPAHGHAHGGPDAGHVPSGIVSGRTTPAIIVPGRTPADIVHGRAPSGIPAGPSPGHLPAAAAHVSGRAPSGILAGPSPGHLPAAAAADTLAQWGLWGMRLSEDLRPPVQHPFAGIVPTARGADDDDQFTPTKHLTAPPHDSSRPAAAHTDTETPLLQKKKGGATDDEMLTPTGYPSPLNAAADMAHSAHPTQPAPRPHRATPRVEDKPPQTRRPHSPFSEGPDPVPSANSGLGGTARSVPSATGPDVTAAATCRDNTTPATPTIGPKDNVHTSVHTRGHTLHTSVHTGHSGAVQTGAVHSGSVPTASVHTSVHTSAAVHTSSIHSPPIGTPRANPPQRTSLPLLFDEGFGTPTEVRELATKFATPPAINQSIKGPIKATHGQGEATSQHSHRGQQTLRHEVPQAWGARPAGRPLDEEAAGSAAITPRSSVPRPTFS